ncbi:hypothetical protein M3A96_09870 [Helcobacillus massiliensis]|uniref:hypothetical protein n=1 Tax=Helcobacillus massiliensis TaxID=521392 RepID=UPI0021A5FB97|nr:hypothetical protein [Helcobacillus massiliensis]MCT1558419.1 hypothetical protein [Helcobacillus massiliensis]MCT2037033.1 hypothetical protein [Helcobacillus massiliensis]MCT2332726.1 hypothetical protein [Helcobacillus massiliensis]MDK7741586.1 hypothetical protein [Helcobacillus massiliensis]WOO92632.1 hypothetical protein R3I40_09485 [Helcobacillus massiliensis]
MSASQSADSRAQSRESAPRQLTGPERALLEAMILRAVPGGGEAVPTGADRDRWLGMLDAFVVSGECGCGLCPSIELEPEPAPDHPSGGERIVLSADLADGSALVLLFIDGGVPSYLEVAPFGDDPVGLPASEQLTIGE